MLTTCSILSMASWDSLLWLARSFLNQVLYSSALMMGIRSLGGKATGGSVQTPGSVFPGQGSTADIFAAASPGGRATADVSFLKKHSVFIHSFNKCLYGTTLMEVYESWASSTKEV